MAIAVSPAIPGEEAERTTRGENRSSWASRKLGRGMVDPATIDFSTPRRHEPVDNKYSMLDDFHWEYTEEPHATRRKQILAKYPDVKRLFGPCPRTKYVTLGLVALQLSLAVHLRDQPLLSWKYLTIVYFIGATANHTLMLAVHEISHNLAFKSVMANRILGIIGNLPIGLPYSVAFKGYHAEHHKYQGVDGIDTDVPTEFEAKYIRGSVGKFLFCFFQIFFYALRPMFVRRQRLTVYHAVNWIIQFAVMFLIWRAYGFGPWCYLLLCSFVCGSFHPMAGHFIAEHYVFIKGYETYSYYGPLNFFGFNVGYHNEHHDFPYIAGSRLPELRRIAPEFYDNLPVVKSWPGTIVQYITNPNMSAFSRMKRMPKKRETAEE